MFSTIPISDMQPEQQGHLCLVAKASLDNPLPDGTVRMALVNLQNNQHVSKEGLVDGLPLKVFTNEHNCVACNKGKQHKASYKHISAVRLITETLQLLHMDLFGPTNIRSIDQKYYSLVVTDDFSRVQKCKTNELCGEKGIKRDYCNPRTPQQNGVAERKNRTLIEAARTMLADSKLPTMFWTEAISTACYVLNRGPLGEFLRAKLMKLSSLLMLLIAQAFRVYNLSKQKRFNTSSRTPDSDVEEK
ncbi:putative ribonuclease H-like domain-containing protein [Tanacetum coccineum]